MIYFVITCIVLISSRGDASIEEEDEDTSSQYLIDLCHFTPCKNNGICKDVGGEGECECNPPYSGKDCSIDTSFQDLIDLCNLTPCKNNGTCKDLGGGVGECECIPPYSGEDCSKDPCSTEPCQNDGKCYFTNNSYKCTCENGFFGENCEYRATEPSSSSISLEKTVSSSTPSTLLETTSPLTTDADTTIETTTKSEVANLDYCYETPCKNGGTCINMSEDYKCDCLPRYSGDNCELVLYSCESPCQNGGICKKKGNDIKCECVEPYSGNFCERGLCEPNPCKNDGVCTTISQNTYNCFCAGSYTGKNCTDDLETTPSITTTQTHSTLISSSTKFIIDFCFVEPCKNGGTCKTESDGYKCICSPLYSGKNCDEETTISSTNSPTVESTTTSTTPGITRGFISDKTTMPSTAISTQGPNITTTTPRTTFKTTMSTKTIPTQEPTTTSTARGTTREPKLTTTSEGTTIDDDLCISSPCLNNGSCISIDNSVRCNCTYPFSGELCGTDLSEKNQSSSNSIVYACTGSAGVIVIVFLIGFSVLWHLKRVKRRKKENYFHNADLSSMESENSRTYII